LNFGLDVFIELKISIFRILVFRFQAQNYATFLVLYV
jgi:hypothetical protein